MTGKKKKKKEEEILSKIWKCNAMRDVAKLLHDTKSYLRDIPLFYEQHTTYRFITASLFGMLFHVSHSCNLCIDFLLSVTRTNIN